VEHELSDKKTELLSNIKVADFGGSPDLLNSIYYHAAHALITTDVTGKITSFNPKAEEMLGYKADELVGKETPAIFHDLDEVIARSKEFSEKLGQNIAPGFETFICHSLLNLKNEFEWIYVHKNGQCFPVLLAITAIKDDGGNIVAFLGIAQDITERKNLEREFDKKNKDFELAQSIAKMGSWTFDIEEGLISWSKEMFNIFPEDINNGEPELEKHKSTIHSEDVDHWASVVGKCIENGEPYLMRFRTFKLEDPSQTVWVEARGEGRLKDGQVKILSGTCQDITDLVLKEEELNNKAEALKRAERVKSEFLANMSHEIRTPMNGIIGMIDLLSETELSIEQKEMVETASVSSEALLELLTDILDLSKIEAENFELENITFNLNQLITNTCKLMDTKAKGNGNHLIHVEDGKDGKELWFEGDSNRIGQILLNFVSNAIKFTSKGKVKIGHEVLGSNNQTTKLKIYVEDNGIGISEENQRNLFDAFKQADSSITRKFGGTGLGLTICSKIAIAMGGEVYLESKENVGSTFILELTLKNGIQPKESKVTQKDNSQLAKVYPHQILLAEDNKINQKVAKLRLQKLGYTCDVVENGAEVLKLLSEKPIGYYTIILMDLQMPVLDGICATKEVIEKWGDKAPLIIALTANAFITDKEKCLEVGMADYLSKPLKKDALVEILMKYSVGTASS
jgi:PAS domain S-box-containing protein